MRPAVRAGLLWGLVAMLSFLVLVEGYVLVGGVVPDAPLVVGIAIGVGGVGSILSHLLAVRLQSRPRPTPTERDDEAR